MQRISAHAEGREDHAHAIVSFSETFGRKELSWGELRAQVAPLPRTHLSMGVTKVTASLPCLPNTEAALIAFLASAALAPLVLCAPDMGHVAILDRFKQIAPKVLIAQDGYVHRGKTIDRRECWQISHRNCPAVRNSSRSPLWVMFPMAIGMGQPVATMMSLRAATQVPFDQPLWIVYSLGHHRHPETHRAWPWRRDLEAANNRCTMT